MNTNVIIEKMGGDKMKKLMMVVCLTMFFASGHGSQHKEFLKTLPDSHSPKQTGSINLVFDYAVLGSELFEKNINDEWQYTRDDGSIGFSVIQDIGKQHTLTLKNQVIIDIENVIFSGLRFDLTLHNPVLSLNYTLRHYFGNELNAKYALGQATVHTLTVKTDIPLFGW